jgi:hypothetical protein
MIPEIRPTSARRIGDTHRSPQRAPAPRKPPCGRAAVPSRLPAVPCGRRPTPRWISGSWTPNVRRSEPRHPEATPRGGRLSSAVSPLPAVRGVERVSRETYGRSVDTHYSGGQRPGELGMANWGHPPIRGGSARERAVDTNHSGGSDRHPATLPGGAVRPGAPGLPRDESASPPRWPSAPGLCRRSLGGGETARSALAIRRRHSRNRGLPPGDLDSTLGGLAGNPARRPCGPDYLSTRF